MSGEITVGPPAVGAAAVALGQHTAGTGSGAGAGASPDVRGGGGGGGGGEGGGGGGDGGRKIPIGLTIPGLGLGAYGSGRSYENDDAGIPGGGGGGGDGGGGLSLAVTPLYPSDTLNFPGTPSYSRRLSSSSTARSSPSPSLGGLGASSRAPSGRMASMDESRASRAMKMSDNGGLELSGFKLGALVFFFTSSFSFRVC